MDGHVAALAVVFPVGEELGHEVLEAEASLLEDARLAILSEDHIIRGEGRCGADSDAFFTG